MRATARLAFAILVSAAVHADAHADAACKSTCTEELRACRGRCVASHGQDRRQCRQRCADASTCSAPGVRLRTTAYTLNECRGEAGTFSFAEKLVVRRGNCDPVTLMELPAVGPVPDPLGLCDLYGQFRIGVGSVAVGRFQRITASPDGAAIVVEVTNDHSVVRDLLPAATPDPPQEGIFVLRSDGSGVRRLGRQSAIPILTLVPDAVGLTIASTGASQGFTFNASGTLIAYEDIGPGPDGRPASQVFVIDLSSPAPEPAQVTNLLPAPADGRITGNVFFVDDRTMLFWNGPAGAPFLIETDGSHLRPLPDVIAIQGATVILEFGIARRGTNVFPIHFPSRPKLSYAPGDDIRELFIIDGTRALQLTNFAYPDTGIYAALGADRVFFASSANPRGMNPQGICQIFSVTPLGAGLRQLTRFAADGREKHGCAIAAANGACKLNGMAVDPVTNALVFISSCDPLGRNPNGEQFFAMRPDGTGLRQTSAFRGVETTDGGVRVEMAGPVAYSTVFR